MACRWKSCSRQWSVHSALSTRNNHGYAKTNHTLHGMCQQYQQWNSGKRNFIITNVWMNASISFNRKCTRTRANQILGKYTSNLFSKNWQIIIIRSVVALNTLILLYKNNTYVYSAIILRGSGLYVAKMLEYSGNDNCTYTLNVNQVENLQTLNKKRYLKIMITIP